MVIAAGFSWSGSLPNYRGWGHRRVLGAKAKLPAQGVRHQGVLKACSARRLCSDDGEEDWSTLPVKWSSHARRAGVAALPGKLLGSASGLSNYREEPRERSATIFAFWRFFDATEEAFSVSRVIDVLWYA